MGDLNVTVNLTLYPLLNATSIPSADVPMAPSADELVHPILLGVFVIGVVVMILLLMIVVLRYIAHQKGSYYTHEEALAFKSNPEVQDVPESLEDPEEEEP